MEHRPAWREGARQQHGRQPRAGVDAHHLEQLPQPVRRQHVRHLAAQHARQKGRAAEQVRRDAERVAGGAPGEGLEGAGEALEGAQVLEGGEVLGDGDLDHVAAGYQAADVGDEEGEHDGAHEGEGGRDAALGLVGGEHVAVAERCEGDDGVVDGNEIARDGVIAVEDCGIVLDEPVVLLAIGPVAAARDCSRGNDVRRDGTSIELDNEVPDACTHMATEEKNSQEFQETQCLACKAADRFLQAHSQTQQPDYPKDFDYSKYFDKSDNIV